MTAQALLVEDDRDFRANLSDYLAAHDFDVREAESLDEAPNRLAEFTPDIILLDQFLGSVDTVDKIGLLTARFRGSLVVLTGNHDIVDRVVMLEGGADDYILKTTSPREILARIRANIRRQVASPPASAPTPLRTIEHDGWSLTYETRRLANPTGRDAQLTAGLRNLFWLLLSNPGQLINRDAAYEVMSGRSGVMVDRNVDNYVSRCRRVVEGLGGDLIVEPVRGRGYRFLGIRARPPADG